MARITLRLLLDHAAAPASRGVRSCAGDPIIAKMIEALVETYPQIPICLHQDHDNNEATCLTAIQHGFTSVMMDGSLEADAKTPSNYHYNVAISGKVVEAAHAVGASVEGELGMLGSLEHDSDHLLTSPDQAVDFVTRTKVDALTIAVGTSHGAYKFTRKPDGESLSMRIIEAIVRSITHCFREVNIDTDCCLAMTAEFRRTAATNREEFDPRKFLKPAMERMRDLCRLRFEQFGTAGQAGKIKVLPMSTMAKRYASGALGRRNETKSAAA